MNDQRSLSQQLEDLIPVANEHGLYDAADWIKHTLASSLTEYVQRLGEDRAALRAANDALEREAAGLRETVERIDQWAHAYPAAQFPEQDLKAIGALLEANGYSMGALHGSWGRDILKGIGEMTRAALAAQEGR